MLENPNKKYLKMDIGYIRSVANYGGSKTKFEIYGGNDPKSFEITGHSGDMLNDPNLIATITQAQVLNAAQAFNDIDISQYQYIEFKITNGHESYAGFRYGLIKMHN